MLKAGHQVIVDELVLRQNLVFLEILSKSFFFLIGKELQLSQLNFQLLSDVHEFIFFFMAEIEFFHKVVFLLF